MNCCRESAKMGVPPGNRPAVPRDWSRGVPERYVAGAGTRGRQGERPDPWSQQVIHEISGLGEKLLSNYRNKWRSGKKKMTDHANNAHRGSSERTKRVRTALTRCRTS